MKRTKINKKSKRKISTIQESIWGYCKALIRQKYPHNCYTCPAKNLVGKNLHTGHMIAKASLGAYLKYDLRILRPQCYQCNMHKGGMGAIFIENMRRIEGDEYVDQILKDMQVTVNAMDWYLKIEQEYKELVNNIDIEIEYS